MFSIDFFFRMFYLENRFSIPKKIKCIKKILRLSAVHFPPLSNQHITAMAPEISALFFSDMLGQRSRVLHYCTVTIHSHRSLSASPLQMQDEWKIRENLNRRSIVLTNLSAQYSTFTTGTLLFSISLNVFILWDWNFILVEQWFPFPSTPSPWQPPFCCFCWLF